ncbi:MAG: hypothetical protein ACR2KG_11610 [Nocardioidaceae bacterium]
MGTPRNALKPRSRAHRNPVVAMRTAVLDLDPTGCRLNPPPIPAGRDWTRAEKARWSELWTSPQANAWDDSAVGTVAMVVIYESAIFAGTASARQAQEARYAADSLGLTPKSMAALGWRIVGGQGD